MQCRILTIKIAHAESELSKSKLGSSENRALATTVHGVSDSDASVRRRGRGGAKGKGTQTHAEPITTTTTTIPMPDDPTITIGTHHVRTVNAENATLIAVGITSQTKNPLLLLPHAGIAVHLINPMPRNTTQSLHHHNVETETLPSPPPISQHSIHAPAMKSMGVLIPMHEVTREGMSIADKAIGISDAQNSVSHITSESPAP